VETGQAGKCKEWRGHLGAGLMTQGAGRELGGGLTSHIPNFKHDIYIYI
jgi:hypothetical protein